jgi:hypothetical protein
VCLADEVASAKKPMRKSLLKQERDTVLWYSFEVIKFARSTDIIIGGRTSNDLDVGWKRRARK